LILNKKKFFSFAFLSFTQAKKRNPFANNSGRVEKKEKKKDKKSALFLSDCADLFSLIANGNVRCWKEGPVGR